MAELGQLERTKRRRLQEAYSDLRLEGAGGDDRQAKLRHLLLGAAADAGLSGRNPQSARELAAAAAASIASVNGGGSNSASARRHAAPQRCLSAPASAAPHSPSYGRGSAGAGPNARQHGPVRAPPPGPMDGGFLPEVDPVQRLSRLQGVPGVGPAAAGGPAAPAPVHTGVAGAGSGLGNNAVPAAPVRHDLPDEYDAALAEADVPSDVELALISIKSDLRSHPASAGLPPLALRAQLADLLADRASVERQLDEQQRANRVRVFKLPTGTDEFGILSTSDYSAAVRAAADAAADAAATADADATTSSHTQQQLTHRVRSAPGALGAAPAPDAAAGSPPCGIPRSSGAYGRGSPGPPPSAGGGGSGGASRQASRWHAAAEAFLLGVVDRFTEFQLSHAHLLHLLGTAPGAGQARRAGGSGPSAEAAEEQLSLLLHLGCLARHTDGDADAFVLAVPGAGKLVKAVLGGRKELTTWLSKRQHREAPEEQVCKLKLRSSCLPPSYHVRDLVGRGAAVRLGSTSGPMIRLAGGRR